MRTLAICGVTRGRPFNNAAHGEGGTLAICGVTRRSVHLLLYGCVVLHEWGDQKERHPAMTAANVARMSEAISGANLAASHPHFAALMRATCYLL